MRNRSLAASLCVPDTWSQTALLIACVLIAGTLYPSQASAGVLDDIKSLFQGKAEAASDMHTRSVQTIPLPKPAMNLNPVSARGGGDVTIVDASALLPDEGPSGTRADIEKPKNTEISLYVVREGDTLSSIAKMYGVSVNTIRWANDIAASGTIHVGQTLVILPVTGLKYTVKKGDTLASIAKKYGADATEIANYNQLGDMTVGMEIIIPDGEIAAPPAPPKSTVRQGGGSSILEAAGYSTSSEYLGYYIAPLAHYRKTQGLHGYNGVDLSSTDGKNAAVIAAATGDVIVAREGGWNGGYGSYVVIQHANGTQTLYSHLSSVAVGIGQHVQQGQIIGYQGQTGKATGPHVHFEIRGGPRNPF